MCRPALAACCKNWSLQPATSESSSAVSLICWTHFAHASQDTAHLQVIITRATLGQAHCVHAMPRTQQTMGLSNSYAPARPGNVARQVDQAVRLRLALARLVALGGLAPGRLAQAALALAAAARRAGGPRSSWPHRARSAGGPTSATRPPCLSLRFLCCGLLSTPIVARHASGTSRCSPRWQLHDCVAVRTCTASQHVTMEPLTDILACSNRPRQEALCVCSTIC